MDEFNNYMFVIKHIKTGNYVYNIKKGKVIFTNSTLLADKYYTYEEANEKAPDGFEVEKIE